MCARVVLHRPTRALTDFGLFVVPGLTPRYNIAPTQNLLTVRTDASGEREGVLLRWGLVPSWSRGPKAGLLVNARCETIASKPAFRSAFKSRRCLVPVDGYYEWKAEGGTKVPHYFHHADGNLFALAGLWERWESDGQVLESVAIITTQANELARPVHDRMPAILPADAQAMWLDPRVKDEEWLADLLLPFPTEAMAVHPVGSGVGSVRHDGPDCIEPVTGGRVQRALF
jgi:putative SOS response-associated peptidase YedK